MSFSMIIQQRLHIGGIIRRYVSTKATKSKPKRTLPDEKLHALIALYHQADTFITPENLSQRIDAAFVATSEPRLKGSLPSVKDLQVSLADQRKAPKISEWDRETLMDRTPGVTDYRDTYQKWSGVKTGRELKVVEALYGVNATKLGTTLPGLDVLREAAANKTIPPPLAPDDLQGFLEAEPMEIPKN